MQLKIPGFDQKKTKKERIEESIASDLRLKCTHEISGLSEILSSIFANYELEKGVFKLKDEKCEHCKTKLTRKGTYDKEIILPGGARLLLKFHQYSCSGCKSKVDRRLGDWFNKGDRYSINVKSDAVRLYLSHLSSFDTVKDELAKIYNLPGLSKRTVRNWISRIGIKSSHILNAQKDFSGHFIYDEEYIKVFTGNVGKKGSKLTKIEVYLLLFRDAITKNVILKLADSLDKSLLIKHWQDFATWTIKNQIPWLTLTTDGKREYNTMTYELNQEFNLNIKHTYCVFHFKKNLFEVSNYYFFGVYSTKKELPEHVKNQIKIISDVIDLPTKELFNDGIKKILFEKNTFISPLQDQIKRLKKYQKNYALHKEFPFLRTTNSCEHWFGQTKPHKIKKGFKTKKGVISIAKALAVKITQNNWNELLNIKKDIEDASQLLISALNYKIVVLNPA